MNSIILIAGPTCVGKTGVSVALARLLGTEVISADSMQVYRRMDIGTGKPTAREMQGVRHHMIDVADPSEDYSSGRYMEAVVPIIEGICRMGKVPVVTGGTGLYMKAMTRGLFSGPSADWPLREGLMKEDSRSLHERLRIMDPEAASGIDPADRRRTVRALEVCMKSGRRVSDLRRTLTRPLPYEFIKVGLTRDRAELYAMIEHRVDMMIRQGLIEEVRTLLGSNPARTPMQAIGYRELAAFLGGLFPLEEAVRLIKRNTKRYARRQYTWFNREEGMHWVDITGIMDPDAALIEVLPVLKEHGVVARDPVRHN